MDNNKKGIPLIIMIPVIAVLILLIVLAIFLLLGANSEQSGESAFETSYDTSSSEDSTPEEPSEETPEMSADEYNELSVEKRNPISKEEFEALPDDEVYIDPKVGEKEIIPGVLPTKGQALNYLYEDALYCYNVIGIFSAIPTVITDPWETKDGGWACYINNEVGTTVLWAIVDSEGKINMGLRGSEYNKDFVGVMYNTSGENPDEEGMKILEEKIIETYGNVKKLKIVSYTGNIVTLQNKDGVEVTIDLNEETEDESV